MTEPLQNPYDQIGRESALRRLVDRFYDIILNSAVETAAMP
jgi:truncated hemoglobin YjbI